MSRHIELGVLLLVDGVALFLAYIGFQSLGGHFGILDNSAMPLPSIGVVVAYWFVLFIFAGLYRERYASSRFDEFVSVFKVVTVGTVLLLFIVLIDRLDMYGARTGVVLFWLLTLITVGGGRLAVRSVQKALVVRGRGVHSAVIVGWSNLVEKVYEDVQRYPAAGLRIVGAVRLQPQPEAQLAVAGESNEALMEEMWLTSEGDAAPTFNSNGLSVAVHSISALPDLIDRLKVEDVLIALGPGDTGYLDEVLRVCDGMKTSSGRPVALKLVPDFYSAIGGMARTEHMYGLPLIEVLPVPTPDWERHSKRIIDLVVSTTILTIGLPAWLLLAISVRMTSKGPAIYSQTRAGRHGEPFTIYKYRTMYHDAEAKTGPIWAEENDTRITRFGRFMRAYRLDEIPQLINVLKGEMSLVGPRPERPEFVEKLSRQIPLYSRRHRVKPGITGLAQVKWHYDKDLEDVRQKLKYDLLYIEHMSLRFDFQILLQTARTVFERRGR